MLGVGVGGSSGTGAESAEWQVNLLIICEASGTLAPQEVKRI